MTIALALGAIALVTVCLAWRLRHKTLKAPATVVIYGAGVCLLIVGAASYRRLIEQRAYDDCVTSVTRSDGNRAQHTWLIDEIERLGGIDLAARGRAELDQNLPARSLDDCVKP